MRDAEFYGSITDEISTDKFKEKNYELSKMFVITKINYFIFNKNTHIFMETPCKQNNE